MQALGPVKNSLRANRATIASGNTEARIFKRNMTRYSLAISPRQGAYGWQTVKETSYQGVDAGCRLEPRHPCRESGGASEVGAAREQPSFDLSASLRAKRSNPLFLCVARWIASLRSQ